MTEENKKCCECCNCCCDPIATALRVLADALEKCGR